MTTMPGAKNDTHSLHSLGGNTAHPNVLIDRRHRPHNYT